MTNASAVDNKIELFKSPKGWMARFIGPHSLEIVSLFDSPIIPTPFTTEASADTVLAEITERNPNVVVYLKQELRMEAK